MIPCCAVSTATRAAEARGRQLQRLVGRRSPWQTETARLLLPVRTPSQAEPRSEVDEVAEVAVVFGFCRAQHDPMVVIDCQ
jgi:hypothetical protein